MNKPIVSFFQVSNPQGEELVHLFRNMVARNGFDLDIRLYPSNNSSAIEFVGAYTQHDIIVVDASIEDASNYGITQKTFLDKVLVVSRTYLPLNYYGVREGGVPYYPESKTNRSIVEWIQVQMQQMLPRIQPRDQGFWSKFGRVANTFLVDMGEASQRKRQKFMQEGQIFISYRSRYYQDVKRIASQVQRDGKTVFFLPPGKLVYEDELLTRMQHWLLSGLIDERVTAAEEIWIYNTADYLSSWWTQAEIVTLVYNLYQNKHVPRVRIFNPNSKSISDAPEDYIPQMNQTQWNRMERLYAQTNPDVMGPEAVGIFAETRDAFPVLNNIPALNEYLNDEVFTQEFWSQPLLPCPKCKMGKAPKRIDLNKFLQLEVPGLYGLTDKEVERLAPGRVRCPSCKSVYRLREASSRYLWLKQEPFSSTANLRELSVYRVST
jgi:hypothetical protein